MLFGILFAVLSPFVVPWCAGRLLNILEGSYIHLAALTSPSKFRTGLKKWHAPLELYSLSKFLQQLSIRRFSHQITERLSSVSSLPVPLIEPYLYSFLFLREASRWEHRR